MNSRRVLLLIPALALTLLAAACGSSTSTTAKTEPVVVASIASGTGSASSYGISQQNGTALAVVELGSGLIDLRTYDDRSDTAGGTEAMRAAIDTGASVVLGPTLSPVAASADPIAQAAGIPVLGVTNATLDIGAIGDLIWRVSLSENAMVSASVTYVAQNKLTNSKNAVLIWEPADGYSTGSAESFRAAARANGITITAEQKYVDGSTAVGSIASAALATSPDVVFMALRSTIAGDFLKATASTSAVRVGGNGFNSASVLASAGAAASGLIVSGSWNINSSNSQSKGFVESYTKAHGVAPDAFAAQGYAAIQVLLAAIKLSQSTDPVAIQAALARIGSVDTLLGRFGFDADHEPTYSAAVQLVIGGEFTLVR
jgi:branched-chain amino acid transport system substrate-binding protein